MKRTIGLIILLVITFSAYSQTNPIDKMFDKYSGKEGVTTIFISSRMFSLIAQADLDDEEFEKMMGNLKSIRILTVEDSVLNSSVNFYKELEKNLDFSSYEELMVVKDGGHDLKFLIREKGRKIEELLMIGGGDENGNVLISIKGDLDLNNIANISKTMGIEQLQGIDGAKSKKKDE